MKKVVCGLAAVSVAAGLSSFTTEDAKFATYYWFKLTPNVAKGSANPAVDNSQVVFHALADEAVVTRPCVNTTLVNKCLVGFTASQVTSVNHTKLIITTNTPTQQSQIYKFTRPN